MKEYRKIISVFLTVILFAMPFVQCFAISGKADSPYTINASDYIQGEYKDVIAYIQQTIKSVYGVKPAVSDKRENCIELVEKGGEKDYSVIYDESRDSAVLAAGGKEAMMSAAYAFLTSVCADGQISDKINYSYCDETDSTDNSALLKYNGKNPKLLSSYTEGLLQTPEWVDSLVMVEVCPDTASIGGTFQNARNLIDYYASVGVNGIWLTPIYDKGTEGNGYSNYGPHTVDPRLTGTNDYAGGWQVVREFVDYAHSKGIYIFLDIITWGTVYNSPLISEHPEWFNGEAWGNAAFDWSNKDLRKWFTDTLINNILVSDADGYRCDCEPNYTGYDIFGAVRKGLAEKGKYITIISEDTGTRKSVYDFEQDGVLDYASMDRAMLYQNPVNFFTDGYLNIVDSVKTGEGIGSYNRDGKKLKRGKSKYYTNCITNHDYQSRNVCGNRLKIGYAAILAPFIPLWYMGDEFNVKNVRAVQYDISVDFSEREITSNAFFLEDVKRMINIRRTYSGIFEKWTLNHRNSNICEVKTDGMDALQNYARYADGKAVIVIGNNDAETNICNVKIPFYQCELNGYKTYTVTDLMTGREILSGTKKDIDKFTAFVPYEYVGVYLVEGQTEKAVQFNLLHLFRELRENITELYIKIKSS